MLASRQRAAILYSLYAGIALGLYGVGVGIGATANRAPSAAQLPPWYTVEAQGELGVHLYFFWSTTCPHCKRAMPFLMANSYELLCTAGFPMIYTRLLTLQELPPVVYYAYLVLYNVVYIIPLGLVVLMFTMTLGSHKLQVEEGRRLKLLSGLMMLNLSLVLLLAPQLLDDMVVAVALVIGAVAVTCLVVVAEFLLKHGHGFKS